MLRLHYAIKDRRLAPSDVSGMSGRFLRWWVAVAGRPLRSGVGLVIVRLRHGEVSGSILIRCTPARAKSLNELQTCTGDPNVEANWHDAAFFAGGKALITGLTPATTVWFRIQTAGLDGVMGAWSDPEKNIVV